MTGPILPLPPGASGRADGQEPCAGRVALREAARSVLRRACEQEFVVPREIRQELQRAGLDADRWKDVLHLAGPALCFRRGRYYYVPAGPSRMRVRVQHQQRSRQAIQRAVRAMIRRQRRDEAVHQERRAQRRYDFNRPVLVLGEDHRLYQFVTRDISVSGIRILANASLLGQEVRMWFTFDADKQTSGFLVRILWSAIVGDGLYENGGLILDVLDEEPHPLQLVDERNEER